MEEFFEKGDFISILHLTDSRKVRDHQARDYVEAYTPRAILESFRLKLTPKVLPSSYSIVMEEADLKWKCPKQQLAMLASKLKSNYIFMGSIGRKGHK